jgi:hypothetical protein
VKIFISPGVGGMEQARVAAAAAASMLGHQVIRAEDFGASSASPQQVCLAGCGLLTRSSCGWRDSWR